MKSPTVVCAAEETDSGYQMLEELIRQRIAVINGPLFTTDAEGLFETYLEGITPARRQHYNCHACKRFFERYGGLATIVPEAGKILSPLWETRDIPPFFFASVALLDNAVSRAKITGVYINEDRIWGTPVTREWTHLSGTPSIPIVSGLLTAFQKMADKKQDYITLSQGLSEIPIAAVEQAVRVLEADAVDRSERALGIAKWLLELHKTIAGAKGPTRNNLIWLAVAEAPPGFCHIRSTMISTLLDDIVAGLPFDDIKARWAAKMHPLRYQRPTTVKDGAIEAAEKIVAQLGSAGALERRYAKLEDVYGILWLPTLAEQVKPKEGGVFDHLKQNKETVSQVELPATTMTWDKFQRTVLSTVLSMECCVPQRGGYYGMVTAVNPEATPILQWDTDPRNPVTWYFYIGGSTAGHWGLLGGSWVKVNAICPAPPHWYYPDKFTHHKPMALFILEGAKDTLHKAGGGFFPEQLRSEYHGIRSVMEAYAQKAAIAGKEEGTANGLALQKDGFETVMVRVTTAGGKAVYRLDRWD